MPCRYSYKSDIGPVMMALAQRRRYAPPLLFLPCLSLCSLIQYGTLITGPCDAPAHMLDNDSLINRDVFEFCRSAVLDQEEVDVDR